MWKVFKNLIRQKRFPNLNDLVIEGHHIHDAVGKAHIFAKHFFPESTHPDNEFHHHILAKVDEILTLVAAVAT